MSRGSQNSVYSKINTTHTCEDSAFMPEPVSLKKMSTSKQAAISEAIQQIPFYALRDNIDMKYWQPFPFKKKCKFRYDAELLEEYFREKRPMIEKHGQKVLATEKECPQTGFWQRLEVRGSAAPPCRENSVMTTHLI